MTQKFNIDKIRNLLYKDLNNGNNIFITGPAGTGKTQFVKNLRNHFLANNVKCVLTSSTGISAINIEGITIHSFLGFGIRNNIDQYKRDYWRSKKWDRVVKDVKKADVIIIDEISMLDNNQIELIDELLKIILRNVKEPFGGMKMIFSGDFCQLPPVRKFDDENIKDHSKLWAFESHAWQHGNIINYYFSKNFRQEDEHFIKILNEIRIGQITNECRMLFSDLENNLPNPNAIKLVSTNSLADDINNNELKSIRKKEHIFIGKTVSYQPNLTEKQIIKNCNAPYELILKVGARVMALKNNAIKKYVNGSLGIVEKISARQVRVKFDSGHTANVEHDIWEFLDSKGNTIATYTQIPLRLAYSITIHKSQGLTFDNVFINARYMFATGQFYVALSRIRKKENAHLQNMLYARIIHSKKISKFYDELKKNCIEFE